MSPIRTIAILTATLIATAISAPAAVSKQEPKRTTVSAETLATLDEHKDLTFATYGDRSLQLDLYRPKSQKRKLPAIVCIHGGGWFKGNRASMRPLAQTLASKGYVTVTISYRLSGEIKFPAQIQDCKAAVRWLRAHADKYGIKSDAIGVTGLSAGGHLAALITTSNHVPKLEGKGGHADYSSSIQAGIAMGAQSDLETDRIRTLSSNPSNPHYSPFLGGTMDQIPETYALASPRHHIDKQDPPLLFMTGELDDPSTHAIDARKDLRKHGIPTGLVVVPKAPHAFLGKQNTFDICVKESEAFFAKHLKK